METKQNLDRIIDTFERNLFSLPVKYQYHWATRRYRIDPDVKYIQPIWSDFQQRTLAAIPKIISVNFFNTPKRIGSQIVANYSTNTIKKKLRVEHYQKHPEILFYFNLIHYLFMVKSYRLRALGELKKHYTKGIGILTKVNWEELFLDPGLIAVNPSAVANNIYYLNFLGVINLERQLIQTYKDYWLSFTPKDPVEWQNKVYGLTHLIIAASYFYQRKVERVKFDWVLEFFENNIDQIIKNTNSDITAEVGLCFKLCGVKSHIVIDKTINHLHTQIDSDLGVIIREDGQNSLEKLEHRNVVATLLMSHWRRLTPGPDLYTFLKEEKKSLYIPIKGKMVGQEIVED
jgi:hypothetical protein